MTTWGPDHPGDPDRPGEPEGAAGRERRADAGGTPRFLPDRLPPHFVVPDDARELALDVQAWQREQRAQRRHARWRRLLFSNHSGAPGVSSLLVALVLVCALSVGALVTVLLPRQTAPVPRQPLARTTAAPGAVGGLLPDVELAVGGQRRPARSLRPAVMAVLPPACGCAGAIEALAGQVNEIGLELNLLAASGTDRQAERIVSSTRRGRVVPTADPLAGIGRAVGAAGLTVVLVRPDGVITAVHRAVTADLRLSSELGRLVS